ncbi:cytochrome-c peroxidase [Spongiivirga citrea]|uniref:Cytochrome-c peroxidase n=1 Tax=Spongiivirga citrea TaxID=1481457 RepID=A0A6M0CLM3_9FLAO|nr:cytochrome c peroxidase [Spongiivirga citrea]NER18835.1 cytochrome-c peroxidase [Spongiivirga citrea]
MNTGKYLLVFLTIILFLSCKNDDYTEVPQSDLDQLLTEVLLKESSTNSLDYFKIPSSDDLANIPQDPKNPLTQEKVLLGKLLYHETGLGVNPKNETGRNTYSCASCHHAQADFQSGMKQGIGEGGIGFGLAGETRAKHSEYIVADLDIQDIRTPTVLNGAFQKVMLWNGQFGATDVNIGTEAQWTAGTPKETNNLGFEGLETQAIAGLGVHRLDVTETLASSLGYTAYFDAAFSNVPATERYTKVTAGLAIAAYERTVLANQAPFQKWLNGDKNALTNDQKEGALLFFEKGQCTTCHTGPALNSMNFNSIGLADLEGDDFFGTVNDATKKGRGGFTGNPLDDFKFKVPQLYNLKNIRFLGHGGSISSVKEIIEYKNNAVAENQNVPANKLDPNFIALGLTEMEIDQLTDFIENGLYDATINRYTPDSVMSGNCIPNNDTVSKEDMGCD